MKSTVGQLLIAGAALNDPSFWRTVVLMIEHNEHGALGLVLNRPSESTVGDAVPELSDIIDSFDDVMVGGPVQPDSVIVMAEFEDPRQAALVTFADVGVLPRGEGHDHSEARIRTARAFAGHAGWGPGQLEAELARGDWIQEAAQWADVFCEDPEALWAGVLERKGGSYTLLARMPEDPSLN